MLEITVWDQPRVQEEESEFMGEVCVLQLFCLDSKISMYLYVGSEQHIIDLYRFISEVNSMKSAFVK